MIYIHTALKSEAQAFVDKFKLQKQKLKEFTVFHNSFIYLIISGLGVKNTTKAISTLRDNFNISKNDIFLNIGICGASKNFYIGEMLEISYVSYDDKTFKLNKYNKQTITCLDEECTKDKYEIVDMESFGFYTATNGLNNVKMFKIVSDNFEPHTVTKDKTKSLIFNNMEQIIEKSSYNWV